MDNPPPPPQRRNSMRYTGYDYTKAGAYFVTICTHGGRSIFGVVTGQEMILNPLGAFADQCCLDLVHKRPTVLLENHVVMPNHVHALLIFAGTTNPPADTGPIQRQFGAPIADSLSTLVAVYKAEVTRRAKRADLMIESPRWQRNFWDRIVRDDVEFETFRHYIETNPTRWREDRFYAR